MYVGTTNTQWGNSSLSTISSIDTAISSDTYTDRVWSFILEKEFGGLTKEEVIKACKEMFPERFI